METTGSGRTDKGVHALQQFLHFDLGVGFNAHECLHKLNCIFPSDIAAKAFYQVGDQTNARFNAVSRSYEYRIIRNKNPFLQRQAYHFTKPVDVKRMNEAAELLLETNDFEAFSKVKTDVNTFLCKIGQATWVCHNDKLIFYVSSDRFLRGMVRAMVGTLLDVGTEKINIQEFKKILGSKDRKKAGLSVPADGLFLTKVAYPEGLLKLI